MPRSAINLTNPRLWSIALTGCSDSRRSLLKGATGISVQMGLRRVLNDQVVGCVEPHITCIEWL